MERKETTTTVVAQKWAKDDFYAPDTVVLGLDIGMEGLGIALRQGREWIYCRTLLMDLPKAAALAERRQMRAARHARKNYRCRMRRLKALFLKHGLPWVSDEVYERSDPFQLRYRAMNQTLASKEALSLCIRSCVALRGYDFYALSRGEGNEFPWGESNALRDAEKWVRTEYIDQEVKEYLLGLAPELIFKGKELGETELSRWEQAVREGAARAEERGIPAMLERYVHPGKHQLNRRDRKARGNNFPRNHVEGHLRTILKKHQHLIDHYQEFVDTLFLPCQTKEQKNRAIFHYNRKTQKEAEALFESKVKKCPYCLWEEVDLPQENCGMNGDKDIQLWKLVDFLSSRTFDMEQNKLPLGRRLFSAAGAEALIRAISEGTPHQWKDIREALEKAIKPLAFAKGEWNQSQIKQLQDIVAPQLKVRCGRAGISSAAARKLYELATASGSLFDPVQWEQWKKESGLYEYRAKIAGSDGGCYPQVERLLGKLRKSGGEPAFATEGLLQSLFRKYRDKLGGKLAPDYCIVECIKNPARNSEECNLFSKEKDKNERRKKEHIAQYGITNPSKSALLRVRLFEEQGGRFHQDDPQKNAPAICPFTGESLGCNPLDQTLELAHLYPDSKGGLYMAENLVLTRRETNQAMGNRTPVEAAALKLPGWMNWEGMLETTAAFHWGKAKRQLFAFTPSEEKSFPDFNNLTRTAQLARELRRMVAIWMGIHDKADAMRLRIGNPSGMYTAAARVSLLGKEYVKDRSYNIHHRKDAAVMTCIPPTGINDVRYGGIFYTAMEGGNRRLYCINDNDGLPLPKFKQLDKLDGAPVFKTLGSGKTRSLGDSTFWAADEEGKVHQHVPLTQASKLNDIMASLRLSDDKADRKAIPTKRIKEWLEQGNSKPLRMNDGTPVKRITKKDAKKICRVPR